MGTEYKKRYTKFIRHIFKGRKKKVASLKALQSIFESKDDV